MKPPEFAKVEELYHAALARPPPERAAFLEKASNGDASLLSEVRSLLGFEEAAKGLLEERAAEEAARKHPLPAWDSSGPVRGYRSDRHGEIG
jgi:hypothetical protein